jgi:hypothetical protein
MRLFDLTALYVLFKNRQRPIGKPLSYKAVEQLLGSVAAYSKWMKRTARSRDLHAARINSFLAAILADGKSPWTVATRRTSLLMLWRFARSIKVVQDLPEGVRTIYKPPLAPEGYSIEAMRRLLAHALAMRHTIRGTGLPAALWWDSFLRAKWDASLRLGDMLRVKVGDFDPAGWRAATGDGWLWAVESKTGKSGWHRLDAVTTEAVAKLLAIGPGRKTIWPGYKPRNFYRAFARLAAAAGLGGTSRWVRSGGASECERLHPGSGWRVLRHSSPVVFEKHYRVAKIANQGAPAPPPLGKLA